MIEKTIPTVLRRGLLGVAICYLASLAMTLVGFCWDLRFGLCLLLLQANFSLFYSMCALSSAEGRRFFSWAARLRFLTLIIAAVLVALHPNDPNQWLCWAWVVGPLWWLSHVLGGAGLYVVYQEYRPGGVAWLTLAVPLWVGLLLVNPFGLPGYLVLAGSLASIGMQTFLFLWPLRPGAERRSLR